MRLHRATSSPVHFDRITHLLRIEVVDPPGAVVLVEVIVVVCPFNEETVTQG